MLGVAIWSGCTEQDPEGEEQVTASTCALLKEKPCRRAWWSSENKGHMNKQCRCPSHRHTVQILTRGVYGRTARQAQMLDQGQ